MAATVAGTLRLSIASLETPIGVLRVVTDGSEALRAVGWLDLEHRLQRDLHRQYGARGFSLEAGRAPNGVARSIRRYFSGELSAIDALPVQTAGTTMSYGALAAKLDSPRAMRAVCHANGSNPISVVVPCHRVIGANGSLTGYGGGLERKRWLLRHEGVGVE